eukprot:6175047-Pleurochrysis_carterae.AAC.1
MTGATVDDYVLGRLRDPKATPASQPTAPTPPPAAATSKQVSCGSKRRRAGPTVGFTARGPGAFRRAVPGGFRRGIEFSSALNKVSNYRHQSWGAQLKKFGRKTVRWRPLSAASVVYNHVDSRTGLSVRRTQSYNSSPMEQMMKRIVAREEASRDVSSAFARPKALRLQQQLRRVQAKV